MRSVPVGSSLYAPPNLAVTIFTDGACLGNPGPGGYGVVVIGPGGRRELSGGFRLTTNNRMEMMAAIVGLEALQEPSEVTLYSDSKYLVDAMMLGWARRWRARGWMRNRIDLAKNPDLWERLLELCPRHRVTLVHVRGHAGNSENERCDKLAVDAAQRTHLPPDPGYREADDHQEGASPKPLLPPTPSEGHKKVIAEGDPCRRCGTPVVQHRITRSKLKPGQQYYYEWDLRCPVCGWRIYAEEGKRQVQQAGLFGDE